MKKSTVRAVAAAAVLLGISVAVAACGGSGGNSNTTATTTLNPNAPQAQQWNPGDDNSGSEGTTTTVPTPESTLPAAQASIDRTDPVAVARGALMIWYSWDTGSDSGPNAGVARAAPLLAAQYAQELTSSGSQTVTDPNWLTWAAQNAIVSADVSDPQPTDGAPTNNPGRKYYIFKVTQTGRTSSGTVVGAPVTRVVAVICSAAGLNGWEVTQVAER